MPAKKKNKSSQRKKKNPKKDVKKKSKVIKKEPKKRYKSEKKNSAKSEQKPDKIKRSDIKFKVGEMIVYPFHGVGIIKSIEKIDVIGQKKWYYTIDFRNGELTVRIPVEQQEEKGIRKVVGKAEVGKIMAILKKRSQSEETDWKVRYGIYLEKLKSGDVYEAAKVARNLSKRGPEGELSMSEKRLLEASIQLLVHEIAHASKKSLEEAENEINKYLRLK